MSRIRPIHLIYIGVALMLIGVILPWLMVLNVIESRLVFSFIAHTASIIGLFIGMFGIFTLVRIQRNRK